MYVDVFSWFMLFMYASILLYVCACMYGKVMYVSWFAYTCIFSVDIMSSVCRIDIARGDCIYTSSFVGDGEACMGCSCSATVFCAVD